jgi:hypothetical protein
MFLSALGIGENIPIFVRSQQQAVPSTISLTKKKPERDTPITKRILLPQPLGKSFRKGRFVIEAFRNQILQSNLSHMSDFQRCHQMSATKLIKNSISNKI